MLILFFKYSVVVKYYFLAIARDLFFSSRRLSRLYSDIRFLQMRVLQSRVQLLFRSNISY